MRGKHSHLGLAYLSRIVIRRRFAGINQAQKFKGRYTEAVRLASEIRLRFLWTFNKSFDPNVHYFTLNTKLIGKFSKQIQA